MTTVLQVFSPKNGGWGPQETDLEEKRYCGNTVYKQYYW